MFKYYLEYMIRYTNIDHKTLALCAHIPRVSTQNSISHVKQNQNRWKVFKKLTKIGDTRQLFRELCI